MAVVTAAAVVRNKDYFTIAIQNDAGTYIDCKIVDAVVYGVESGVMPASGTLTYTQKTFT